MRSDQYTCCNCSFSHVRIFLCVKAGGRLLLPLVASCLDKENEVDIDQIEWLLHTCSLQLICV